MTEENSVDYDKANREISGGLWRMISEKGLTLKAAAEIVTPELGIAPTSCYQLVCDMTRGKLGISQYLTRDNEKIMWRLGVILHALGADENHELVRKIKTTYPDFNFPPVVPKERIKKSDLLKKVASLDETEREKVSRYIDSLDTNKSLEQQAVDMARLEHSRAVADFYS